MNQEQTKKLKALKTQLPYFARNCLKIKTKDAKIIPFVFNQSQEYFHDICEDELKTKGRVRIVVIKGRQSGISTYVSARYYHKTSTSKAINTFILSHESSTTDKLFSMVKLYNENNPIAPETKRSNAKELSFSELNSQYYIGTAGSGDVGRGGTVQLFHGSEVGFWKNTDDIETGLMESIPDMDGTEIILESTGNGLGNYLHRMAMGALKKENGYRLVFIPWFWMDEYEEDYEDDFTLTDDELEYRETYLSDYDTHTAKRKLKWRRAKIARYGNEWKFKQEYPSNVSEAFQTSSTSLISAENVYKARKRPKLVGNQAPLIMGVDPARINDRAAIVFRRGREIEQIITYEDTNDDIWFADKIISFIDKYNPVIVNIDCTNSWAIHDYIRNKGYGSIIRGYHFGNKATDEMTYANKRAEIWCLLRDWLGEDDVSIPDDDELHADLTCVPDYDETDGKIRLAKKEDIKKQMGFSPDIGDACALTFATRISSSIGVKKENKTSGLKTMKKFEKLGKKGLGRR
jgi:hypothetical protein